MSRTHAIPRFRLVVWHRTRHGRVDGAAWLTDRGDLARPWASEQSALVLQLDVTNEASIAAAVSAPHASG